MRRSSRRPKDARQELLGLQANEFALQSVLTRKNARSARAFFQAPSGFWGCGFWGWQLLLEVVDLGFEVLGVEFLSFWVLGF